MYTTLNPTFILQNWGMQGYTDFFFIFAQGEAVLTCTHNKQVLSKKKKKSTFLSFKKQMKFREF